MKNAFLALTLLASSLEARPHPKAKMVAVTVATAALTALDARTSWGKRELVPMYASGPLHTYGPRGLFFEGSSTAGILCVEWWRYVRAKDKNAASNRAILHLLPLDGIRAGSVVWNSRQR